MATTGTSANEFFEWVNPWWDLAKEWLSDPHSCDNPWPWDGWHWRAREFPDRVDDIDIRPVKKLLRSIVAFNDPGMFPHAGSRKTIDELHDIAAEAWDAYESLRYRRDAIEFGDDDDDPWHGWQSTSDYADELKVSPTVVKDRVRELKDDGLTQRRGPRGPINMRESVCQQLKRKC